MSKKQHNIKPGLYCSEDGESLVEVRTRDTSLSYNYVVFNRLLPTEVNGVRVNPLIEVPLSEERFAALYPAKVVGYRFEFGEGFATTIEQDRLYCSYRNTKVIVRVINKFRDRDKTEFASYVLLYPTRDTTTILTLQKDSFLHQYPCLVTGCVVEQGG